MNPQYLTTLATHPKMMATSSFDAFLSCIKATRKNRMKAECEDDGCSVRPAMQMVGGVAIISVHGPLMSRTPAWIKSCIAVTDFEDIDREIDQALAMGATAIGFDFDSPGGLAYPCDATARKIAALTIPTTGHASGMACSAAYYLMAGTDHISAAPGSVVGNIGTILTLSDTSKAWEAMGIKWTALTNEGATLKSTWHLPSITSEQEDFLQSEVDSLGAEFRAFVESNRPGINPELFKAGWYHGQKAVELGLVDEII